MRRMAFYNVRRNFQVPFVLTFVLVTAVKLQTNNFDIASTPTGKALASRIDRGKAVVIKQNTKGAENKNEKKKKNKANKKKQS